MTEISNPSMLIIARMTPRLNSRTRKLIKALSDHFSIRVISENSESREIRIRILDGAELVEIPLSIPDHQLWYFTGILKVIEFNLFSTWDAIRHNHTVIVCSDSLYIFPGILAKKLFGRKFVYNSHEIMGGMNNPPFVSCILNWLERLAINTCDFWMVPSDARARIILNTHKLEKPYIVYANYPMLKQPSLDRNVYRSHFVSLGLHDEKPIVIFQGSLTEKRGIEELVQAAARGNFSLVIQGKGSLQAYLKKHMHENMLLLDACPNDEVLEWLNAADLSFVYYENDCINSAYAESSKFYSSIFAGTPILCNKLPAFQIFAEKYGGIKFINVLNPNEIDRSITDIFNSPDYYERLRNEVIQARNQLIEMPEEEIIKRAFSDWN